MGMFTLVVSGIFANRIFWQRVIRYSTAKKAKNQWRSKNLMDDVKNILANVNICRVGPPDKIWMRGDNSGHWVRGGKSDQLGSRQLWQVQHLHLQRDGQHHLEHQLHPANHPEGAEKEVTWPCWSKFSSSSVTPPLFCLNCKFQKCQRVKMLSSSVSPDQTGSNSRVSQIPQLHNTPVWAPIIGTLFWSRQIIRSSSWQRHKLVLAISRPPGGLEEAAGGRAPGRPPYPPHKDGGTTIPSQDGPWWTGYWYKL